MNPPESLPRGAALMVASALFFALMGLGVKLASAAGLSNAMVVFGRNLFGLIALAPWAALRLRGTGSGRPAWREHLVRSLAGLASMYCYFYAIAHVGLAEAVLLTYSLPLFMPAIASLWLGEPFPRGLWPGLVLGFLGIALVLKPGSALFQPAALIGLGSALFAALAQVGVRRLTATEPVTRIVLYFAVVSTVVSVLPAGLDQSWPSSRGWWLLAATGTVATVAQLLLTRAYAHAPAAQVGPFIYACVPFAALFDGALLGHWPDRLTSAGAVLVCAAGAFILRGAAAPPP
jgi:drug/metabolite transporter (DMT)-like permease